MMVGWVGAKAGPDAVNPQGHSENPVPLSPFIMSEPEENGAIYHEVQPGQTAWTIAAYYEIDLPELLSLNDLTEGSILHPGDRLLIRPPDSPPASPTSKSAIVITTTQPTAVRPTPDPTPTAPTLVVQAEPLRVTEIPIFVIVGLGIVLFAGLGLVRMRVPREQKKA